MSTYAERYEKIVDAFTREMYQQRSQSPQEMTDERWNRVKAKFPGSVRCCRADVLNFHEDEIVSAAMREGQ